MINQIRQIPAYSRPLGLTGLVARIDTSLRELSVHFDDCLTALDKPTAKGRFRAGRTADPARRLFEAMKG